MAQKLTDRTTTATADGLDYIHVVDVSDVTDSPQGTSKKITKDNFLQGVGGVTNWGDIGGTIGSQTDLQNQFSTKLDTTATAADSSKLNNLAPTKYVSNDADTFVGSGAVQNIITLSQAEYDGIVTKDNNTLYLTV